jgi:4-hydroxy-2-oxoglutarate aldolase
MDRNYKEKLSGVFPPCMTAFEKDAVAYDKIRANIERYNTTPLRGYMPLGSNGEFQSLTDEESIKIIDVYRKHKAKSKVMIAGAARESAYTTGEFIKKIADKGIDFATILPPHYFVEFMTDEALLKYYTTIADHAPIPIMVYNAPKFASGLLLSPALITKLAQHPNIAGMKDTSKEDITTYVKAVPSGANFFVLAGTINKFYKGLQVGAIGGVLSIANYLPTMCCQLYTLFVEGKQEEAQKMDIYLRDLSSNAAGKAGVAGVKAAMDVLGFFGGDPRVPVLPLSDKEKADLKAVLDKEKLT